MVGLPSENALLACTVLQEETDTVLGMARRVQALDLDVTSSNVECLLVLDDSVRARRKGSGVCFDAGALRVVLELTKGIPKLCSCLVPKSIE
jgi:hypothetical protein